MNKFYTSIKSNDGFGAQYQRIIQTYIYCKSINLNFVYEPLEIVEHNYDNDIEYNNKLETLMNLKNNITNVNTLGNVHNLDLSECNEIFDVSTADVEFVIANTPATSKKVD